MKRVLHGIGVLGIVLLPGSSALAQAGGGQPAPPPMTNLQVFPKDTPRAQVIQTMNAFNSSLGIQCDYCHVPGGPDGRLDFASDAKRTKVVARQMILLRDSINVILPVVVGKPAGAGPTAGAGSPEAPMRVLCSTCHRGLPIPKQIADVLTDAEAGGGGVKAGLAKFKELRAQFFGGQSYDFSENGLVSIAQRAITGKRPDDAMAYLQANLEYYPKSARTYQVMAQARNAKGDKTGAIRDLEKAAELDPKSVPIRNELRQLKGQ